MRFSKALSPLAALVVAVAGIALAPQGATAATPGRSHYNVHRVEVPGGPKQLMRWDPCQRITYKVNVRGIRGRAAKNRAVREVRVSARRLARVSGLPLRYTGRTARVPRPGNLRRQRPDIVVAFVRPRQTGYSLRGSAAGYGGASAIIRHDRGRYTVELTKGFVVVDHPQTRGWRTSLVRRGVTRPALISHELGHAVGLQHVRDRRQLMHPTIHRGTPQTFARGDRAGLRRVGRPAGCIG